MLFLSPQFLWMKVVFWWFFSLVRYWLSSTNVQYNLLSLFMCGIMVVPGISMIISYAVIPIPSAFVLFQFILLSLIKKLLNRRGLFISANCRNKNFLRWWKYIGCWPTCHKTKKTKRLKCIQEFYYRGLFSVKWITYIHFDTVKHRKTSNNTSYGAKTVLVKSRR